MRGLVFISRALILIALAFAVGIVTFHLADAHGLPHYGIFLGGAFGSVIGAHLNRWVWESLS